MYILGLKTQNQYPTAKEKNNNINSRQISIEFNSEVLQYFSVVDLSHSNLI